MMRKILFYFILYASPKTFIVFNIYVVYSAYAKRATYSLQKWKIVTFNVYYCCICVCLCVCERYCCCCFQHFSVENNPLPIFPWILLFKYQNILSPHPFDVKESIFFLIKTNNEKMGFGFRLMPCCINSACTHPFFSLFLSFAMLIFHIRNNMCLFYLVSLRYQQYFSSSF